MTWPVMNFASSLARYTAAQATSSGVPKGIPARRDLSGAVISVSIQPGAMAFTRMPRGATSLDNDRVIPRMAALAVAYGTGPLPDVPMTLAMFMIDPAICAFINFKASRQQ